MSRRAFVIFSLGLASFVSLTACSDASSDSTTGKRIALHTSVTAESTTKTTFTTGFGWDVTLTKAAIATSGLYYFDGPPPTASRKRPTPGIGERLAGLFIGTAWAHPGHYQAGTALGQVILTEPAALNLFSTPIALPDGDGITGIYRSARFVVPSTAPTDPVLGGHVAIAEGKASKHDGTTAQPIFFRLIADFADVTRSIKNGAVDGCVLDETTVTDSGTISLEIKPTIWLNLVDFSKFEPGSEAAPTEARSDGFSQGITQLSAYHFAYSK